MQSSDKMLARLLAGQQQLDAQACASAPVSNTRNKYAAPALRIKFRYLLESAAVLLSKFAVITLCHSAWLYTVRMCCLAVHDLKPVDHNCQSMHICSTGAILLFVNVSLISCQQWYKRQLFVILYMYSLIHIVIF